MRKSMYGFKYNNKREYAEFYVQSILEQYETVLKQHNFDAIIPVPIHKNKVKKRGYNQAEVLAKELSKTLEVPLLTDYLLRVVDTTPQKELNDKEREKNLKKAFQLNKNRVKLKKVMLVDDIYTTGTTLDICTKELLNAGVKQVYCVTVCIGEGY